MAKDPIEVAINSAARNVLNRRAATLRKMAEGLTTTTLDANKREVLITTPEAVVLFRNAALFEAVADELDGGAR